MVVDQSALALLGRVFFAFCKGADTPVSLGCWLRYKYGEFSQLVNKSVTPDQYSSCSHFERDYAVTKYLSKYKWLPTGIDLDAVALSGWKAAELQCLETNKTLRLGRIRGFSPRVEAVLFTAKRKIFDLLGELNTSRALGSCGWGPGSTYTLKGEYSTLDDKIREYPISVTHTALPYIKAVIESDPHWARAIGINAEGPFTLLPCCFTTVRGCRATLVDKSAKTKRSIAIEPTGNIFLQLGIGKFLRRRLRGVGIDLNDQTQNQNLANLGSRTGDLATLDLASASDTVSRELIYELFPLDWAMLLDSVRSPELTWDQGKSWTKLEKFSSMGNGFTFELESLIFWSLTSAVAEVSRVEGAIGVFGDDIICPVKCVPQLLEVLTLCGFSVNAEKSFWSGPFRESCGKHFWDGEDVTPAYQKEYPGKPEEIYRTCNRLYRYAVRRTAFGRVANRSWVSASWHAAIEVVCELVHKGCFNPLSTRRNSNGRHSGYTWRDDAIKRGFRITSFEDVLLYLASRRVHVIPFGNQSDDGLMLPFGKLGPFICSRDGHGGIKLPVYSFRPTKRKLESGDSLLAYWLRFGCEEPLNMAVTPSRRGKYVSRRRWFYDANYVSDLSTLDVAPG